MKLLIDVLILLHSSKVFRRERGIDPISASLDQPIEFLTKIFKSGVGYLSVGTQDQPCHLFPLWSAEHPLGNIPLFRGL